MLQAVKLVSQSSTAAQHDLPCYDVSPSVPMAGRGVLVQPMVAGNVRLSIQTREHAALMLCQLLIAVLVQVDRLDSNWHRVWQ